MKGIKGLNKETKELYSSLGRSLFLCFVALFAIVTATAAWFVLNTEVNSSSSTVSTNEGMIYSIATLKSDNQGVYDANLSNNNAITETPLAKALNKFFRADNNGRDDNEGNHYTSFYNLPNLSIGNDIFTDKNHIEYILGSSDGISLMVSDTSNMNNANEFEHIGPGSCGKFSFYIIPHTDNLRQVKLSVSLNLYTLVREGEASDKVAIGRAELIENNENNSVLLNMVMGHVLLFTGMDKGNYNGRITPILNDDGTISFNFVNSCQDSSSWEKDKPVEVSIYWIWPKRFENIKYYGQEGSVFKSDCDSYNELLRWINDNKQYIVNTKNVNVYGLESPIGNLTNQQFAKWSNGYNKGDQLIGDNVAFIQWVIEGK